MVVCFWFWQMSMSVKPQTLVTKTLTVWTLMDLTHVLVNQDSLEMGLLVLVGDCFSLVVRRFILPVPKLWKCDLKTIWEDSCYVLLCNHRLESLGTLTKKYDFSTILKSSGNAAKALSRLTYIVNLKYFHPGTFQLKYVEIRHCVADIFVFSLKCWWTYLRFTLCKAYITFWRRLMQDLRIKNSLFIVTLLL